MVPRAGLITNVVRALDATSIGIDDLTLRHLLTRTCFTRSPLRGLRVGAVKGLRWALSDIQVLAWRTLARIIATPEQVLNITVQPLVFVVLFSYMFNGAILLPVHGSYRDYLIADIVAVNMRGTAKGATIGLAVDLQSELMDRFRSLPMSRATVIAPDV